MASLITLENFTESNGIVNSPRSLEACLRQGVDPVDLLPRSFESFLVKGKPKEVANLKYEHFEQKRKELLRVVRRERAAIIEVLKQYNIDTDEIDDEDEKSVLSPSPPPKRGVTSTRISPSKLPASLMSPKSEFGSQIVSKDVNLMVQKEKMRLEKLKQRQAQEIQQMMEYELKVQQQLEENFRRQEEEKDRLDARKREREEAKKLETERKRQIQLEKKQREDEEERERQYQAKLIHRMEQQRKVEQLRQEQERRMESEARERERRKKLQDFKDKAQAMQKKEEEVKRVKMEKMARDEAIRCKKLQAQQEYHRKKQAEQRLKANRRISAAKKKNEEILAKRRHDFELKQAEVKKRNDFKRIKDAQALEQKHQLVVSENKRKKKANALSKKQELDRKEMLEKKFEDHEQRIKEIAKQRNTEREIKLCQKSIKAQDKLANIERMKRIDEFVRLQTLQKIQMDDERTKHIAIMKKSLIDERKLAAKEAKVQKFRLNQTMEKIRMSKNWKGLKLEKIISDKHPSGAKKTTKKKKGKKKIAVKKLPDVPDQIEDK